MSTIDRVNNLPFSDHEKVLILDAVLAVHQAELWDWLATSQISSFMFSDNPNIQQINRNIKYDGHSGLSYGWTMRVVERIAKKGWDSFEDDRETVTEPSTPVIQ